MAYKVYSNELKLAVINEYLVVKKLKIAEIKTKYELSTPVLIYDWVKQYQTKCEQAFIKKSKFTNPTSHRIDKEYIEIKILKKENEKLRKKSLKDEVEIELLKEQLACGKSLTITNIKNKLSCKCLKNKCFLIAEKG